jgi:hypothetical protein
MPQLSWAHEGMSETHAAPASTSAHAHTEMKPTSLQHPDNRILLERQEGLGEMGPIVSTAQKQHSLPQSSKTQHNAGSPTVPYVRLNVRF